jgi:hypothetical protein
MGHYAAAVAVVFVMGISPLYAQDAQFVVTATSAEVHKTPSTGSAVIGRAPRGKSFQVVRELGSWVRVSWPEAQDGVGYLHTAWGTISHGTTAQAAAAATAETPAARPAFESDSPASASQATQNAQTPVTNTPSPRTLPRPAGPAPSLPSHVIGLGGRVGTSTIGFAAAVRAWTHGPLGVQVEAGRSTITSAVTLDIVKSMQLTPSVIFSPPNVVTNAIWTRPYLGAGVNLSRSTLRSSFGFPDIVENGIGAQLLGGAEFTWASAPQFAVSVDLRQQWAPATFDGFELGGFAASMSVHWYMK